MNSRYQPSSDEMLEFLEPYVRDAMPPALEHVQVVDIHAAYAPGARMENCRVYLQPDAFAIAQFNNADTQLQPCVDGLIAVLPKGKLWTDMEWVVLLPQPSCSDPLAQRGFIGWKRKPCKCKVDRVRGADGTIRDACDCGQRGVRP